MPDLSKQDHILEQFKNHYAKYWVTNELGSTVERIVFQNPQSRIFYCEFLGIGGDLIVRGDIYDAIYSTTQLHYLQWWAGCNASYLGSKLMDLDGHGESRYEWDEKEALNQLAQSKVDLEKEVEDDLREEFDGGWDSEEAPSDEDFNNWKRERMQRCREYKGAEARLLQWNSEPPEEHVSSRHEWENFLENYGDEIFGDDHWEYTSKIGQIDNRMINVQLTGLKLAIKQLKDAGVTLL